MWIFGLAAAVGLLMMIKPKARTQPPAPILNWRVIYTDTAGKQHTRYAATPSMLKKLVMSLMSRMSLAESKTLKIFDPQGVLVPENRIKDVLGV